MSHDQPQSSPFRKVSMATWADKRVRELSPVVPSGRALFIMLMIGQQTTNVPGVQPVGRLAFAEMLDWEPEAFDKAFHEVLDQGLAKADWKARLVFVPKAIEHNLPQSPNVVKSWASTWARVPDCDLKAEAWETIYRALLALGESFATAFKAACPLDSAAVKAIGKSGGEDSGKESAKASRKASQKASAKPTDNQEQEQEKEQEKEKDMGASAPGLSDPGLTDPPAAAEPPEAPPADGPAKPAEGGPADPPAGGEPPPPEAGEKLPRALGVRELVAEGVGRQHAEDWLKVRRAKGAPLTPTAWDAVKTEAAEAGITVAEAVKVSAVNSWQGFKAKWYARLQQEAQPKPPASRSAAHGGFDERNYGTGGLL